MAASKKAPEKENEKKDVIVTEKKTASRKKSTDAAAVPSAEAAEKPKRNYTRKKVVSEEKTVTAAETREIKEAAPEDKPKTAPKKKTSSGTSKKAAEEKPVIEEKPAEKKKSGRKPAAEKAAETATAEEAKEVKEEAVKAEVKPAEKKKSGRKPAAKKAAGTATAAEEKPVIEEKPAEKKKASAGTRKKTAAAEVKPEADKAEEKPKRNYTRKKAVPAVEAPAPAAEEEKPMVVEPAVEAPVIAEQTSLIIEPAPEPEVTAAESEPAAESETAESAAESDAAGPAAPEMPAEPVAETEAEIINEKEAAPQKEAALPQPRRSVAFIGSECYPFVKTGGLGDVMYALPKALIAQNCDVKVILPRYKCIPQKYQDKMIYRGEFYMELCSDGRKFYVGIMEYVWDGVVYDFIDNEEFFSAGNPYISLVDDIPKFCLFSKAALAALNYMNWIPDIIHCHDWQAALVPLYLHTLFEGTPVANAKTILTIHNLRFQGIYNIPTVKYWTGLPDYVFNKDVLTQNWLDANMLKGGLAYTNMITTVSNTYAWEIQTPFYGEGLDAHLRYHSGKLRGIVNGIDCEMWDSANDDKLAANYDITNVLENKRKNKRALQEQLGLEVDDGKFVIGLISRLTDQKGLDLVNSIIPALVDGNTQIVILGTGDKKYEDSFRYYEHAYKGSVCSNIMYDEGRAHLIYAGSDALLVPSLFEPCGLTQLIAMRYGTVPIVRETGGLKDTVMPYNQYTNDGNGFTFDRYEAGLLLDAINRAKTLFFTDRWRWDEMVQRDMAKDVSWDNSAKQYRALYLELKP